MFQLMAYAQFGLVGAFLVLSPFFIAAIKKNHTIFLAIWIELYIAQLFMYLPGTDVSPYAFVHSKIEAIRVMSLTLSAAVSIVLVFFIFATFVMRIKKYSKKAIYMMILALIPNLLNLVRSSDLTGNLDTFLKVISPFVICFYLQKIIDRENVRDFKTAITAINIFMIAQVLACKLMYGHFAAYNYYYEMSEEYFGYYNHPHSFTCLLAVLSIWCIYQMNKRQNVPLNIVLFVLNLLLMFISGVRTYFIALIAGLLFVGIYSLMMRSMKNLRKYVYIAVVLLVIAGPALITSFGSTRVTEDVSSGRIDRWTADISYAINNYSWFDKLFGAGLDASVQANKVLFDVAINSLNVFVDMFMNYGIIGMIMMIIAYSYIFRLTWSKKQKGFQIGMLVFLLTACFINSIVSYITIMSMIVVILYIFKVEGEMDSEGLSLKSAAVS